MRRNILTLLVGFVVLFSSVLLFKVGLDKMTDAQAATTEPIVDHRVEMGRHAILYRVRSGDTLWALAERFYGNAHRWPEIARANGIEDGAALTAGEIIRIPLAENPQPEDETDRATELIVYDNQTDAPPAGLAIDPSALGVTLCRLDSERFPAGALCVVSMGEDLTVTLNIYDARATDAATPVATCEIGRDLHLREISSGDFDGDGIEEIYTVWQTDAADGTRDSRLLSRVYRFDGGRLKLVCETPDDPVAVARSRRATR